MVKSITIVFESTKPNASKLFKEIALLVKNSKVKFKPYILSLNKEKQSDWK